MACVPEIILCETVTFRNNQFSYISKGKYIQFDECIIKCNNILNYKIIFIDQVTLKDYRKDNCLKIDGDSVVLVSKGNVIVACVNKIKEELPICKSMQSTVKEYLSIIGVTISILCLIATIITYTVHSTLRAGPGLCVLSLSSTLLLAQITFLVNASVLDHIHVCVFIGAVQHYTWISAFCWMNVIAVDIWKVFLK